MMINFFIEISLQEWIVYAATVGIGLVLLAFFILKSNKNFEDMN